MAVLKKILKWTCILLASLLVLAAVAYGYVSANLSKRMDQVYQFDDETIELKADSVTLARGKHLVIIKGCQDCHGQQLEGKVMAEDPALGRLVASNLTSGKGGLPEGYDTSDWVRAMRHGVGTDGKALLFMPSHETTLLSRDDLSAIIAFCQQAPAVDHALPDNDVGPVAKVMAYLDKMPLLSVEKIDHRNPMVAAADTAQGVALGKYLAISCSGCHRPDFKGGDPVAPGFPPVPDLTRTGNPGKWTQAAFVQTLRTGKTPSGHQIDNENMPWKMTAQYEDKELASLYAFFQSLN